MAKIETRIIINVHVKQFFHKCTAAELTEAERFVSSGEFQVLKREQIRMEHKQAKHATA